MPFETLKFEDLFITFNDPERLVNDPLMIARSGGVINSHIREQGYESLISKLIPDIKYEKNYLLRYIGQISYYDFLDFNFSFGTPLMLGDYSNLFFPPIGVDANHVSVEK